MLPEQVLALFVVSLVAATVNGALGYGFSSITVPLALRMLPSRMLNPALVLVELVINTHVLWVNRAAAPAVARRVLPIVIGLAPGIVAGSALVAYLDAGFLKLGTYGALLPLILLQAAGFRRPIQSERTAGAVFGTGVGLLYGLTTISGPPLAVALNNQGLTRQEFRAALGLVRLAESSLAVASYAYFGLFTQASLSLLPPIVPAVLLGVPLGAWLIRQVEAEAFRRVCMSFDAWVVAFGFGAVLQELRLAGPAAGAAVVVVVAAVDAGLLYRFFSTRRRPSPPRERRAAAGASR